jgi:hypothetical protein
MRIVFSTRYTFKNLRTRADMFGSMIRTRRTARRESARAFLALAFGE